MNTGIKRLRALFDGMHFRFIGLVAAIVTGMLAVQLTTDTLRELNRKREANVTQALETTSLLARSLEKQFNFFELDDIEAILVDVRKREGIKRLLVSDAERTFYLDGDLATSPRAAFDDNPLHARAMDSGETVVAVDRNLIMVTEPLLLGGSGGISGASLFSQAQKTAIGTVMIAFENPGLMATLIPIVKSKLVTAIPLLLIGLFFAWNLVSQMTAPLRNLTESAKAVAAGDLDRKVSGGGGLEIDQLATSFNQMVETVRQNIARIYDLAYVDKITRLPNREFFRRELSRSVSKAQRLGTSGALLFLDLDGFKRVNDTAGHDSGDRLLADFAERITSIVRESDQVSYDAAPVADAMDKDETGKNKTFARLGGDEFTILLPEIRTETDAAAVARRIISAVSEPFKIDGKSINIGVSIGIATFPRDGNDPQSLLKHSDMAMYQAKEEGKNTYRFYNEELNEIAGRRLEIENDLRKALQNDELELYYQPKIDTLTGKVAGLEGLIRWHHPQRGMVNPGEFIQIAEDCGLILPLGDFVIARACKQICEFAKLGLSIPIAVNISTQQFSRADFANTVALLLRTSGADPTLLELEVTESMAMSNPDLAIEHIDALRKKGVRFAIDDFGTGYSNLAQLSKLPFDVFKIDRSFVCAMREEGGHGETIIRTIIAMAHALGYETVAEGVETKEQVKALEVCGCRVMQGFHFAKPMPIGDMMAWLEAQPKTGSTKRRVA